jgi:hypothetical protein
MKLFNAIIYSILIASCGINKKSFEKEDFKNLKVFQYPFSYTRKTCIKYNEIKKEKFYKIINYKSKYFNKYNHLINKLDSLKFIKEIDLKEKINLCVRYKAVYKYKNRKKIIIYFLDNKEILLCNRIYSTDSLLLNDLRVPY